MKKNLTSLHSQAPGGAVANTPKSTRSRQFSPAVARSQLGKHSPDLCSRLLAPSSQPFTHFPCWKKVFKANQEGGGVRDLVQTILEGARSSQKLLPPRGLHFDSASDDLPSELLPKVAAAALYAQAPLRHHLSLCATAMVGPWGPVQAPHSQVPMASAPGVHLLPLLTFRPQLPQKLSFLPPSPPPGGLCPLGHSQHTVPNPFTLLCLNCVEAAQGQGM